MPVLTSQQRGTLETAVKQARKLAETGARNALHTLAVDHPEPFSHMSPDQRALRNRLRHKARLLGDDLPATGNQQIERLSYELAYENWHKMLFAKFLESNGLLMHPSGVAITMEECEELAREEEFIDKWDAAATYASKMLPAIFRTDDPLMQIQFAADDRIKLEAIIDALNSYIFTADDALGWVYQFWQSDAKAAINASGDKIDGAKLPAVTQLFTEPYMVHFLIDNTLGAWWVSRNPGVLPPVKFEYLRLPDNVPPASSRSDNSQIGSLNYYNPYEEVIHVKGNLPHWRQEGKLYFVTFRTADSMPQKLLKEWESEMDAWKSQNPEPHTPEQKKEYYRRFPAKMQEYLDAGHGACHLKDEKIKIVVENALRFFNGDRYDLDEYVVAGNHVHVLVEPRGNHQLSEILHSWKSFTANEIHKITNESGAFWQKESFDHLVRSEASLEKFREYIRKHIISHSNSAISGGENTHRQDCNSAILAEKESNTNLRQDSNSAISGGENTHRQDCNSAILAEKESNNNLRQDAGATLAFPGWPNKTSEVTSLDPCMGSGHFVASLFPVFAALRMYEEGLTKEEATDKVITENLHGLELDARCTQIAAFNLALTAWKFCGHYKQLPEMNLACSGIAPKGKVEDWVKLVGKVARDDQERMENGMRMLYDHFQLAPELGSLLDPSTLKADAFTASFEQLQPVLAKALEGEADKDLVERGVMAAGIAKAGELLSKKYTLQITNVPYLLRRKQSEVLYTYGLNNYTNSSHDLATIFLEKLLKSNIIGGTTAIVIPQNWNSLPRYKLLRKELLKDFSWDFVVRLGAKCFQTMMWDFNVMLLAISNTKPKENKILSIDVSEEKTILLKENSLKTFSPSFFSQKAQLTNPDMRIVNEDISNSLILSEFADSRFGLRTADTNRFIAFFWETNHLEDWEFHQSTVSKTNSYSGKQNIIFWEKGKGQLSAYTDLGLASLQGRDAWGKKGIVVSLMGDLPVTLYEGNFFDNNCAVIWPLTEDCLLPIWSYCSSNKFKQNVRKLDQKLNVTNATLLKIPFDLHYWQNISLELFPQGLPKPYSDDPTQWLFHGHPIKAENPLQVALARLLGYRWPAENVQAASSSLNTNTTSSGVNNNAAGSSVYDTLADEAKELINQIKAFDHLTDEDGIFCIPSVNAEEAGADRLRAYLQEVFGSDWNNQTISQLLTKVEAASSSLEDYLRKEFFAQHCKLFQNRPFIWHIWDGRSDGFSALVNYHKLTKENLNKLIYTYLGDWIRMCDAKKKAEESGAEGLLSAALKLKEKLEAILQGEAPYDIFVRWKPLSQQPLGWDPDLNDGVRLNIRPFVEAGVLRSKFNIKWGIDRGKNPPGSPWGEVRDNDRHLSLEKKREARENKSQ